MVQPCLQDHIPTGSYPENETCDTTESSDLKLCPFKNHLKAKNPQKGDTEVQVKPRGIRKKSRLNIKMLPEKVGEIINSGGSSGNVRKWHKSNDNQQNIIIL